MKKFKIILATLAIFALVDCSKAAVLDQNFGSFSLQGTAWNAGTNYAIFPTQSRTGGEALVTYLNASCLFASGTCTLTAYGATNQTTCTATNLGTTTNIVASTNGFAPNTWVVIQHVTMNQLPRAQYELGYVSLVTQTNQVILTAAPTYNVASGDIIYQLTALGTIPFASSATATSIPGEVGLISGQRNAPLALVLQGSAAGTNTINAATVIYQP